MFERPDQINQTLYVVTPIFNSQRFRSRWRLYEQFAKHVEDAGAKLYTVELAFGERAHAVTSSVHPRHIQLRTGGDRVGHEAWMKECLINLAVQRLPADWKYVATIDADVTFARSDWVGETLHALQHYQVVQMFSEAQQLTHDYKKQQEYYGFCYCAKHPELLPPSINTPQRAFSKPRQNDYYIRGTGDVCFWHPGFCWAWRRDAWDALSGLIDWSVLGGADLYMAHALHGTLAGRTLPRSLGDVGRRWLVEWQNRATEAIHGNVGYVSGLLLHHWHGSRSERRYKDRGQILIRANFNPELDLKRDSQGVWQLTNRSPKLRDGIRAYLSARNEDAI